MQARGRAAAAVEVAVESEVEQCAVCNVERVEQQRLDDVQRARDSEQEGKKDMWQGRILNRWGGVGDRDEEGEILYMQSGCVL